MAIRGAKTPTRLRNGSAAGTRKLSTSTSRRPDLTGRGWATVAVPSSGSRELTLR